jgi:hypothetical protein
MKTLQAVSGIGAFVCMALIHFVSEDWSGDLFGGAVICLPVFIYTSHIIGLENQDKEGGARG